MISLVFSTERVKRFCVAKGSGKTARRAHQLCCTKSRDPLCHYIANLLRLFSTDSSKTWEKKAEKICLPPAFTTCKQLVYIVSMLLNGSYDAGGKQMKTTFLFMCCAYLYCIYCRLRRACFALLLLAIHVLHERYTKAYN